MSSPAAARAGRRRRDGFTLVEILASLLFLAIAVPAIVAALGLASRTSELAERGSIAGGLAENKLNEMLVDSNWQSAAQASGDFGAEFPGYRWQMTTQNWAGGGAPGAGATGMSTGTGTSGSTGSTGTTGSSSGTNGLSSTTGTGGTATLTQLSVEVFYKVRGDERSVQLTTLAATFTTASSTGTSTSSTP